MRPSTSTSDSRPSHSPRDGARPADPLVPNISLPKGGGAIRGLGEKYSVDAATGTGGMVIPLPVSPGRGGFGPQLALAYNSAAGNGPFGYGWSLSLPAVSRKTDRGLPRYDDANDPDVFLLAGGDDLVPAVDEAGEPLVDTTGVPGFVVQRFRPRVEVGFARIERWTRADGDVHWRVLSPDNVLAVYGRDGGARVFDPADPRRVFSWLLCETRDDRGNAILYRYAPEDTARVDVTLLHEGGRGDASGPSRTANRYLKSVRYGNRVPLLDQSGRRPTDLSSQAIATAGWLFEAIFDYGEHDADRPTPGDGGMWLCRHDPFSACRAGFEVRTYRLCQRVLLFHHFPDEPGVRADCLVRSVAFAYRETRGVPADRQLGHPAGAFLNSVTQTGYLREGTGYTAKSMPPVSFTYSRAAIGAHVERLDETSAANLPAGVDGGAYQWVDLDGEGLPGVLAEQFGGWYYKPNLGGGRLGPVRAVAPRPSLAALSGGRQALLDLAGDGQVELVLLDRPIAGFYERAATAEGWESFVPFVEWPNVDWSSPNLRLLDLTGDGLADLLVTEDWVFTWYPSRGESGFGPGERLPHALDESRGPRVIFGDGAETLFLADMSGDGLTDLVRIRNGEVCYWPSLGYGRFGAKMSMDSAPWFDTPDRFDPRRVRLADIDGSGVADLLYTGDGGVRMWANESGNGWAAPLRLPDLPSLDAESSVQVIDLLGRGTACLVWSSPLPAAGPPRVQYLDLTGGVKPHLLVGVSNNMGAETRVTYVPSTAFYLADREAGRPWVTRLPFPVQVVERTEALDHIAGTRFVSRYSYHHGHYDGAEREFRGFGRVDREDTEAFEDYVAGVPTGGEHDTTRELYQPPVTTRTWHHTGGFADDSSPLHRLRSEYYGGTQHLPAPELPAGMTAPEYSECVRALKGAVLRQEVFSFDGSPQEQHPFSVSESAYRVVRVQPQDDRPNAVFFTHPCESLSHTYERNPADPRVAHSLTLEVGPYGNPMQTASVVYGRRIVAPGLPSEVTNAQRRTFVTIAEIDYTSDHDRTAPAPAFRLRTAFESRSYEITGANPAGERFTRGELVGKVATATPLEYEQTAAGPGIQKRLLDQSRTLFRDDALAPLPLGQWDTLGLGFESYRLAFTPGVVATHYAGTISAADFTSAGYVPFANDANWWVPSGTAVYPANPAAQFFLPDGGRNPFGIETRVVRDKYHLLTERVRVVQAAWSETRATNDYRVLCPVLLTDPNQNRSAVEHDPLGLVVKSAVLGKASAGEGDTLADPTVRVEYDLFNWMSNARPNFTHTFAREKHGAANPRWQESYTHFDGSGGVALVKAQAHPGKALRPTPGGGATEVDANPRWVGNGRSVRNNKGNPVKQYQPYFSTTHEYEGEEAVRGLGPTPILYYDAVGRNVRTSFPDGTLTRVEFTPWWGRTFDPNDTVKESRWYTDRGSPDPTTVPEPVNDPDRRAAWLAAQHAGTPGTAHLDSVGRPMYAIADYGGGKTAAVRSEIDLTGRYSKVFDQLGRLVGSGFAGMGGTPVFGETAEKGGRWTFPDVAGALVRTWDAHGRAFRSEFDALRRPVGLWVEETGQAARLFNYVIYGDRHPNAVANNLLGTAHQMFDPAGMVRVPAIDFTGNPLSAERLLTADPTTTPNWAGLLTQPDYASIQSAAAASLDTTEVFTASSEYDALGRPARVTLHGGTIIEPQFNEANFPSAIRVKVQGAAGFTDFLEEQDYDAKGQRQFARYGNDVTSRYFYDPHSFRLTRLLSVKVGDPEASSLQDLRYTYDPVGNIAQVADAAQQTHFFANAVVKAEGLYEYDAIYQLSKAGGRERAGSANDTGRDHGDLEFVPQMPHANDTAVVRNYTERYEYDLAGNLLKHRHMGGATGSWTRHYRYAYQDNPANRTNRLASTSRPGDPDAGPYSATYDYDVYGNMTHLITPTPGEFTWDFLDQLQRVDLGGGGTAHYVYGTGGQRVRKVIDRPNGLRVERIYLGALEIFRVRRGSAAPHFERRTIHISDNAGRIAQVDVKTTDTDGLDPANPLNATLVRYQLTNHLGSAVLETDAAGAVISYEEYHPFGTSAYRSGKPGVNMSLKRYRFSGKERDDETGLYYFGARYYPPWLGRWLNPDPAGFVSGFNLYRYCSNDPVGRSDPNGMQDEVRCDVYNPHVGWIPGGGIGAECGGPNTRPITPDGQAPPGDAGPNAGAPPTPLPGTPPPATPAEPGGSGGGNPHPPALNPEKPDTGDGSDGGPHGNIGSAVTTHDSVLRGGYERADRQNSQAAQDAVAGAKKSGNAADAMSAAEEASRLRNQGRLETQRKVSPPARWLSEWLEGERGFDKMKERYSTRLPSGEVPRGTPNVHPTTDQFEIARRIAVASGEPRWYMSGAGKAGRVLGPVGMGLSVFALGNDIYHRDWAMASGDALTVAGTGLEMYALFNGGAAATVLGVSAVSLGLVLGGAGIAITSGISAYRAFQAGDITTGIVDSVGVVAGTAVAVGAGILLASAAGVAVGAGLIAAAPILIGVGLVAAAGVGLYHLAKWLWD